MNSYNANAKNIYDMLGIDYTASEESVRNNYLDFVKKNDLSLEEVKIIGAEFVKFFKLHKEVYDNQMETSYGKEFDNEVRQNESMVNTHHDSVFFEDSVNSFNQTSNRNTYSDGDDKRKFKSQRKGHKGRIKNMYDKEKGIKKEIDIYTEENGKKERKKVFIILFAASIILASTAIYISLHNVHDNEMKANNVIAVYTVQKGDTYKGLDKTFYRYDMIYDDLDYESMTDEKKSVAIKNASINHDYLLEGDEALVVTNEKVVDEKKDAIRLATGEEIDELYNKGKLWKTKESVERWLADSSLYITADNNMLKK